MAHPRIDADVQMAHTGLSETEVSAPDAGTVFAHAVQSAGNKIYGCGRIHSGQIGFVSNESYAIHQVEEQPCRDVKSAQRIGKVSVYGFFAGAEPVKGRAVGAERAVIRAEGQH